MNNRTKSLRLGLVPGLFLAFAALATFAAQAEAQSLGSAEPFAVLGASTVTNTGATIISGDVGVSPGSAITGFPPGVIMNGALHANDGIAMQAHADLATAYTAFAGLPCPPNHNLSGTDLGGLTLTPGVYCFNTSATSGGALTLDAQNNPNARFVIQIGTTLITSSASSVVLINGASAQNVFFQVGSSATLGSGSSFIGSILANVSVTAVSGVTLSGRLLAVTGAVTLDTNMVTRPPAGCPPVWSTGPNFPAVGVVRAVGNDFPFNGRFYAMGGRSADTAGSDFTHPFEYNPATNAWVTKAGTYPDINVNNMACGVLTVAGTPQIYCVGGSAAGGTTAAARVFSYNPVTDTITALTTADNWPGDSGGTTLPGGFAVSGNKLYILGGFTIGGSALNSIYQFDPTLAVGSRWTLKTATLPVPLAYIPAATIGGFIYTGGGATVAAGVLTDSNNSYRYDPAADIITTITNIPRATGETRAVVVNGQMWVLGGGRTAPNPANEVDIYTPGTNTWAVGPNFVTARRNFPADSDGSSRVWLAGGYAPTAPVNTMEIYGPGICATPTPTPTGTPSATPTATPTATSPPGTPTPTPTPGGTPTPTPTPGPAQLLNISTRSFVQTGDNVSIGGFIITGSAPKHVVLRAIGPSLTPTGIPDLLADPVLELHGPGAFVTITDDNWRDDPVQAALIQADGLAPTNNLESAIDAILPPGAYTGIVRGKNNTSGVALIEVYDLNPSAASNLANLSTRAFVSTGDDIVIAGFMLGHNSGPDRIVVRGIGPSLAPGIFPASAVLADPMLELRDSSGTLLISDNDWQDNPAQAAIISAAGLAPTNPREAAIAATLPPGAYTALLTGLNSGTGIGLVEVYDRGGGP